MIGKKDIKLQKDSDSQNNKNQSGILLVQAGSSDWEPTQDELEQLTNMFTTALSDPDNAAVLTVRRGVTAEFIPVPKEWFGTGWKLVNLKD